MDCKVLNCECCKIILSYNEIEEHTRTEEHQKNLIEFLRKYKEEQSKLLFNNIE